MTAGRRDRLIIDGLQYCNWSEKIFRELRAGGVSAIHVTICYHENFRETISNITTWNRWFQDHADLIMPACTADDVRQAKRTGRTAVIFGFQNPAPVEDDLGLVEIWHRLGVRFMREGRMQTVLIIVGVAAGVAVIAYISALISGLQANTLAKTLGAQAHVTLRAPDDGVLQADVVAELVRMFGPGVAGPEHFFIRRWGVDPWTLGYVTEWRAGDVMAVGPLHGTHAPPFYVCGSDQWVCGYMEGAVRSGEAAAADVAAARR